MEGKNWEFVPIPYEKKLCLYPFSKNSIKYLYKNVLIRGHQTPRYIIRDIIEPVISDLIYNASNFPSIKYRLVNINTTLNFMVHNQVKDEEQADRVFRFMSIWGNNQAKQFTYENITYIAGIPAFIYKELGLPIVNLQETTEIPTSESHPSAEAKLESTSEKIQELGETIPPEKQKKFDDAKVILTQWANGLPINLSITGGAEGTIRTAREDMGNFLLEAINWQAEGVSWDNVSKVKASKYKLVALQNQIQGNGFYILPANWDSLSVIDAFIRWREFGNQSWKYPKSDFDVYIITSWISKIKKQIIQAVQAYDEKNESKYIEAAIASEMYRLILNGEYREKTLGNLTPEYLLCDHQAKNKNTYHASEWNSLLAVMHQKDADNINKNTVRQYFNLLQGNSNRSVVVLDSINLSKVVRKVKANKLKIPENEIQSDDKVKLRKDTYSFYVDITNRVDKVAKAEIAAAKKAICPIYECFDDDDIEEEDIEILLRKIIEFYKEIDNTQINVKTVSINGVKKAIKQIAKAIKDINNVLDTEDTLSILMAFSGDPIGMLQPLLTLINQVSADIMGVDKQITIRKNKLGAVGLEEENDDLYKDEIATIGEDIALLEILR